MAIEMLCCGRMIREGVGWVFVSRRELRRGYSVRVREMALMMKGRAVRDGVMGEGVVVM